MKLWNQISKTNTPIICIKARNVNYSYSFIGQSVLTFNNTIDFRIHVEDFDGFKLTMWPGSEISSSTILKINLRAWSLACI